MGIEGPLDLARRALSNDICHKKRKNIKEKGGLKRKYYQKNRINAKKSEKIAQKNKKK